MIIRSRCIAALTTVLALSSVAGASAMTKTHKVSTTASHAKTVKTTTAAKTKGGTGVIKPIKTTGTAVAMISAFPAGGKGSGTEATCGLWSDRLQEDENAQNEATDKDDVIATTNTLNSDVNNALDAGCVVID
jgi:hypothetical protein